MSLLVETMRIEDGRVLNAGFHNERMMRSLFELFGLNIVADLERSIKVPEFANKGVFKCRVVYNDKSSEVEFLPYVFRQIRSLRIVIDNNISYPYKVTDRENIVRLFESRGNCDDILIIKNGMVTDTSYANVVLRDFNGDWITPSTFLLPGTRRASLLQRGVIAEANVGLSDISRYSEIRLINAMMSIDDSRGIPAAEIYSKFHY